MSNNTVDMRYLRQIRVPSLGERGQELLGKARVLVVGAGALGNPALMYLVAAGVGSIGILDSDEVDASNLHRQVLYTDSDVGTPKVQSAVNRLSDMNPNISFIQHFVRLHKDNALDILKDYDLVIECSDNFPTKFLVNDACVMLGKPCIIGAAIQLSGQLSVYNYKGGPTFRCFIEEEPDPLEVPSCAEAGVIGMIPGIIGTMQALEALKVITGIGETLSGRLLHFDGQAMNFSEFDIKLNPNNLNIKGFRDYDYSCPDSLLAGRQIDSDSFLEMLNDSKQPMVLAFSDDGKPLVALTYEWETIPTYELPNKAFSLPRDIDIVLVCEYGIKSLAALRYLVGKQNFHRVYNLKEGIAHLRIKS
jgi:adenylyltransferase/sulfurtransferase